MLKIFDSHKKSVGVFDDDNAFLRFIRDQENQKLLNPTVGMVYWGFSHYLPSQFKNLCTWVKPEFLTLPQLRALEKGLGLVEICRGDFRKIQEIPVTGDVDVEDLKKKLEASMKAANLTRHETEKAVAKAEYLQKEEMRLKIELGRAMEEIKKLKLAKAQAGLGRSIGSQNRTGKPGGNKPGQAA